MPSIGSILLQFQLFIGYSVYILYIKKNIHTAFVQLTFIHHRHTSCIAGGELLISCVGHGAHKTVAITVEIIVPFTAFSADNVVWV
jgi:hypothetical protein